MEGNFYCHEKQKTLMKANVYFYGSKYEKTNNVVDPAGLTSCLDLFPLD